MAIGAFVRDQAGLIEGEYRNATDALLVAIAELKATGGGTVWIHRPSCADPFDNEECECFPVPLEVESDLPN